MNHDHTAGAPRRHWMLDPEVIFLNHGSFGACPLPVLDAQRAWRERMEREPVGFFVRDLEGLLDAALAEVGAFLGADPRDLAFVPNATTGVNAVLRSLDLAQGDELLTTDHAYNACRNALEYVAARAGARVVVARIPLPLRSPDDVLDAIVSAIGSRTRLALIDHVTSPTGLVLPVERIVAALAERGVDTLVDGAHAPGMLPLDLEGLGAAYYTGNFHKWVCAPKGAAFLHVRRDRQDRVRPTVISHGANSPRADRSRFRMEFDWVGTLDPSPYLSVPAALRFGASLRPGGWPELMRAGRALALRAREVLCSALGTEAPAPASMIGTLAAVPLPAGKSTAAGSPLYSDPLQSQLFEKYRIEVPIVPWPAPPARLVRVSAAPYNRLEEYEQLASALRALLGS